MAGAAILARAGMDETPLAFRSVNRRHTPQHDPDLQRHHILPKALMRQASLARMIEDLGRQRIAIDDFRANGMLLPARECAALRTALPLHRGPHRAYNDMVIERVGLIERGWVFAQRRDPEFARRRALIKLAELRAKLRLQLLDRRQPLRLNRRDPVGAGTDFTQLDAMAELLWRATG